MACVSFLHAKVRCCCAWPACAGHRARCITSACSVPAHTRVCEQRETSPCMSTTWMATSCIRAPACSGVRACCDMSERETAGVQAAGPDWPVRPGPRQRPAGRGHLLLRGRPLRAGCAPLEAPPASVRPSAFIRALRFHSRSAACWVLAAWVVGVEALLGCRQRDKLGHV